MQIVLRFVIGGLVVSAFAILGDLLKPKSFAGLFGAAPSVALATLALTIATKGKLYTAEELRATTCGAVALFAYAAGVSRLMMRHQIGALLATSSLIPLWLAIAIGGWFLFIK